MQGRKCQYSGLLAWAEGRIVDVAKRRGSLVIDPLAGRFACTTTRQSYGSRVAVCTHRLHYIATGAQRRPYTPNNGPVTGSK